jgi:hypothetical protein
MRNASIVLCVVVAAVLTATAVACAATAVDAPSDTRRRGRETATLPGAETTKSDKCLRPSDEHGPLYYEVSGIFARISVDRGGGQTVVLKRSSEATEDYHRATDELIDQLRSMRTGTAVTLVSYAVSSLSGGEPPFSCVELK